MTETLQLIMDQLIPVDKHKEDTPYHRTIRDQTKQPLYTMDDKEFTMEESKQVIESFQHKKAPGLNGITNDIIKLVFKDTKNNDSDLQRMLQNRTLPSKLENSKDPPNSQTEKRKECRNVKVPPN